MAIINTSDLQSGMILASDAIGANGRLLLPKGTVLADQHLRVLKIWGAVDANIQDITRKDAQEASLHSLLPEHITAAKEYVDRLFAEADVNIPPMQELYSICLKSYAQRIAQGDSLSPAFFDWTPISESAQPLHMDLQTFVQEDKGLVSFPDIYFRISKALEDPSSTASKLAEIISKDPSISAKLLSLVNSPFYGFGQRIDSLSRCVALVGAKELNQLAMGVAVMNLFVGIPDGIVTVRGFWQHSIACGVLCRILASHIRTVQQERCFVVGLLHDIGRLIMLKLAPQEVARAINTSRVNRIPLQAAEKIIFGFDHTEVAEALFNRWNIPSELVESVAEHHATHTPTRQESAICAVADTLAIAMGHGSNGTINVHTISPEMWNALDLPESVLEATISAASRQLHDIFTVFIN